MNFIAIQERSILILLFFSVVSFKYKIKEKRITTPTYLLFYSITTFTAFQVLYWYLAFVFVFLFLQHEVKSEITSMTHILEIIGLETGLLLTFMNDIWNRKNQEQFLNGILDLEKVAKKLMFTFKQDECHEHIRKISIRLYIVVAIFDAFVFIIQAYLRPDIKLLTASLYYRLCEHLFNRLIIFLLMLVKMQKYILQACNENLQQLISSKKLSTNDLLILLKIYKKLLKSIKQFKSSFGMVCTAIFLYIVGCQTCDMYLGPFNTLNLEITRKSIINAVMNTVWVFPTIFLFSYFAFDCKRTHDEAHKIYYILDRRSFEDQSAKETVNSF